MQTFNYEVDHKSDIYLKEVEPYFSKEKYLGDYKYFDKNKYDYLDILLCKDEGELKAILVSEVLDGKVVATHSLKLGHIVHLYKLHKILYDKYRSIFFQVDLRNKKSLRGCEILVKGLNYNKVEGKNFMYYNK